MNGKMINKLKNMFGNNFIGPEQVNKLLSMMDLPLIQEDDVPELNFAIEDLRDKTKDFLLVLGYPGSKEQPLNIYSFREIFGVNPEIREPCLYNQDWYLQEAFIRKTLETKWYLLKRDVIENSRAVLPQELIQLNLEFPTAILCVYSFFSVYFSYGDYLWYHDFVWCSDRDHNGDRIYVGKYHDIDGVNKNGFSIHRHLALRPCYGAIVVQG